MRERVGEVEDASTGIVSLFMQRSGWVEWKEGRAVRMGGKRGLEQRKESRMGDGGMRKWNSYRDWFLVEL